MEQTPTARSSRVVDPRETLDRALTGDRRSLARLISAVEERSDAAVAIGRRLAPLAGTAHVVGITGAPGVGKSTTTSALVSLWRSRGHRVAVVAIDPSSPFTGGALLGDRIRMTEHSTDPEVFIRSMAARGQLGGLSAATPGAIRVLDACGFDIVVVETVGVGQNEVDVVRFADTVLIAMAPGMGDRIQANKAGLLEIGDVIAVNKSDRPGADATRRELRAMISAKPLHEGEWRPPVLGITAAEGVGIDKLATALADHHQTAMDSGQLAVRRAARTSAEITSLAEESVAQRIADRRGDLAGLSAQVLSGELDPYAAADQLLADIGVTGEGR
ncbi:MAG: methylmalonyl Co-A mutase-associated GTPase MeaB [Actinomycetia bacterium]|nr:methylmalonyl Co-A mutase-associated GTPase MeaB [Actinomycetes bacterium]MCH9800756.1 methylmalonyl Co-A mutase-associated GTPase MeaB [Actinomycetes bacterium]